MTETEKKDNSAMVSDASAQHADKVRPLTVPGDARPDDADAIPAEHEAGDVRPIDRPSMGGADGDEPSQAFLAAQRADAKARERGDTIEAGQLLWIAAANASPAIPPEIRNADDDTLAGHMLAMGHLTVGELAWINARPRQGRAA